MNIKINNAMAFNTYVWGRLILFVLLIAFLVLQRTSMPQLFQNELIITYLFFTIILLLIALILIEYIIKPAYFYMEIIDGRILFKYFQPDRKMNVLFYILMISYKNKIKEQIIERETYNSYKILIKNLGLNKKLIFQKLEKGKVYESQPMNISFLSSKKYTELILSIDRLHEKINLN